MEQILVPLSDRDRFIVARWAYSVGSPVMSDAEYTVLLRMMQQTLPNDEYVQRSWSSDPCPTALLKAIGREDLIYKVVLSDKTESIPSLNTDWEVKNELGNVHCKGTVSMKHDGWNIQINYYNGKLVLINTRGRSSDAIDVTSLAEFVPNEIPFKGPCKVVLEMTISKVNYITCARLFNNVSSRSAVATVLSKPEYFHLLSFTAFDVHGYNLNGRCKFEVLKELGFNVPAYYEVNSYDEIIIAAQQLSEEEPEYDQPTDGVVYDGEFRRAIRLYAWEEPIYYSFVTEYLEQYGPYRISPSVIIYPVLRKGSTQRQISMTNWQRIVDYNLQPGAPIAFRIASSATADFDEDATRLAHKQWENNWEQYQKTIKENEEINRCQRQLFLHSTLV
jgi:hypothetical protein